MPTDTVTPRGGPTLKRPSIKKPRVNFSTRNLYVELRDKMHVLSRRKNWSIEYVLNAALKRGLEILEAESRK